MAGREGVATLPRQPCIFTTADGRVVSTAARKPPPAPTLKLAAAAAAARVIRVENDDAKGQWLGLVARFGRLAARQAARCRWSSCWQLLLPSA